jgi:glucose-6-phosphate isomerase
VIAELKKHADPALKIKDVIEDARRLEQLTFSVGGIFADLSKNILTLDVCAKLVTEAEKAGLAPAIAAQFAGDKINSTEKRAVLHTALRAGKDAKIIVDGADITPDIRATLDRMRVFATDLRAGNWRGHSGREITDIVNIGIGGSSLGPQLATQALTFFHHPRLKAHFVANVEASDLACTLAKINPETTLFIVASKTFTTAETMQNAHLARDWLVAHYNGDAQAVARHFVAASTNTAAVEAFGISADNMFPFRDWVGGRYSLWSSIGLSVMLMAGPENFDRLLSSARAMDDHFRTAPFDRNLPVMLALIGVWYRNALNMPAAAVIPYHAQLQRLPAFLQQLDMESNGKSVDKDGRSVVHATGPMIFGEPGTDAQHSFFQWLHQSPDTVPVDFIVCKKTPYGTPAQQKMLLSNCLAQSRALMMGKDGGAEPHRHFSGNRPSNTFVLDSLSPETFGALIAMYEHKVFVQGVLWNVNSYDQWGVELGKVMAKEIEQTLTTGASDAQDASTRQLIDYLRS